jgi:Sec-independent protein translocase protein TatA
MQVPHLPELLLTLFIMAMVFSAHNLRRLGDGLGRLLERTFGKR